MLWSRTRAPGTPAFRRQRPIGPYVLDFYCAKARLAVAVDGMNHHAENRAQGDARRDALLRAQGVTVRRIAAAEVLSGVDDAADGIVRQAMEMIAATPLHHPSAGPSPPQAGEDSARPPRA